MNTHRLQEYGTAGLSMHVIKDICTDKLFLAPQLTISDIAMALSVGISYFAISVYKWALGGEFAQPISDFVVEAVDTLGSEVWAALLGPAIIIAAVWMGWVGLIRQRATKVLEGAGWMLAALVLGMWVLYSPSQVVNLASDVTLWGADGAHWAVSQIDVDVTGISQCPGDEHGDNGESEITTDHTAEWMWSNLLCRPWVQTYFGSSPQAQEVASSYGQDMISVQSISRTEMHYIESGDTDESDLSEFKQEEYKRITGEIEEDYESTYFMLSGDQASSRLAHASISLLGSIGAGGLILAVGISIILLRVSFLALMLLAPFFFLVGVHPGGGRRVLTRWLDIVLGLLIKQIIMTWLLLLVGLLCLVVWSSDMSWAMQTIFLSLVGAAALIYRKHLSKLVRSASDVVSPQVLVARGDQSGQAKSVGSTPVGTTSTRAVSRTRDVARTVRSVYQSTSTVVEKGVGAMRRGGTGQGHRPPSPSGTPSTASPIPETTRPDGTASAQRGPGPRQSRPDPGGSGRARAPHNAPPLRKSTAQGSAADERMAGREEQRSDRSGQSWGDVHQAQRGQQRRRDRRHESEDSG